MLHELPDAREYTALRAAAGLSAKDGEAVEAALSRSIFSAIVRDESGTLVGMGRIIGDGGCYYQIVDIVLHPSDEGGTLRQAIMDELADYLNRNAPKGADVWVMSDVPSVGLYQKYGFAFTYPHAISLHKQLI